MKWILLLFSCLPCLAQFPYSGTTWCLLSSGVPSPLSIPGLAQWYVYSDQPTNITMSNWVDRIQGLYMTNGDASTRPTNSSLGVGFNGSTFLTNRVLCVSNDNTFVLIVQTAAINGGGTSVLEAVVDPTTDPYWMQSSKFELNANIWFNLQANHLNDWIICMRDIDPTKVKGFTNGIAAATGAGLSTAGEFFNLAKSRFNLNYVGYVLELMWFTNNITTNSSWVSTVHTYATNKYNFSP